MLQRLVSQRRRLSATHGQIGLIAVSGAIAVISITGPLVSNVLQVVIDPTHAVLGRFSSWPSRWLFVVCYAPLVLWGPLLLIVAVHYYRRRGFE